MTADELQKKYDLTEEQIQMLKESTEPEFVPSESWNEVSAEIFEKYRHSHLGQSQ